MKKIYFILLGIAILLSGLVVAQTLVIRSNSEDPNLYVSLGDFLLENDYDSSAIKAYERALELDPDYERARNNLALLYYENEDYSKAIEHLQILVENNPDNLNYNYDLAINLAHKFRYEGYGEDDLNQAISYFEKVLELDSDFEHAQTNLDVLNKIKVEL